MENTNDDFLEKLKLEMNPVLEEAPEVITPKTTKDSKPSGDDFLSTLKEGYSKITANVTNEDREFSKAAVSTVNLSKYDGNIKALQSYGSRFKKYGYNPRIDNLKLYQDLTTDTEAWSRALTGFTKLKDIGFTDNFGFGVLAGENAHKEYEDIVATYSSQKGGSAGFTQNLLINAGYTGGIIADMALEEAALALGTMATGGAASAYTAPLMVAKWTSSINKIRKAYNGYSNLRKVIKTVDAVKDVSKGRKALNATGRFFNPLGNTTSFVKTLNNAGTLKDANNITKFAHGTGSVFRDVKAIHLAFTEANLEGNMLNDELYQNLVDKHKGPLTNSDIKRYRETSMTASNWAKGENMFAIAATNKLVFNNMYKAFDDLKGIGKRLNSTRFYNVFKPKTGVARLERKLFGGIPERAKMMFADGFGTGVKRALKGTVKGIGSKGGTYFTANIGEGFQENLQEMINAKNMHMYGSRHHGDYFDSMLAGIKDQFTAQGGETFLSGFLMGGLISPVNMTVKAVSSIKADSYKAFTNRKEFKATRQAEKLRLESDVNLINEAFEHPADIFKDHGLKLAQQAAYDEEMLEASMNDNKYDFQRIKEKGYRAELHTLMQYDMMDQFQEHLGEMKTMDAQQFQEAFPTVGKNLTKSQRDEIIDRKIEKAKSFKIHYENVKKNVINPVDLAKLDKNDPDYQVAKNYHTYFEKSKEELIFSQAAFEENLKTKQDLMEAVRDDFGGTKGIGGEITGEIDTSFNEYQKLFSSGSITAEVELLSGEIAAIQYAEATPKEKAILKKKQAKLDSLIRFKESLDEMQSVTRELAQLENEDPDFLTPAGKKEIKKLTKQKKDATIRLYNRHGDYLKNISPNMTEAKFQNVAESTFEKLHDYYKLESANEVHDLVINILTNDGLLHEKIQRDMEMTEVFMAQFKTYVKNSLTQSRNNELVDQALNALYAKGIGFPLSDLDNLIEKGISPPVFYNLENGKKITRMDSTFDKDGNKTGEVKNEMYAEAFEIILKLNEDLHGTRKELVELTEEQAEEVENLEKSGESRELAINKIVDNSGGAPDRTIEIVTPSDENDVAIVEGDSVSSYPTTVLTDLIAAYKEEIAAENIVADEEIDTLTPENLTTQFSKWAENQPTEEERAGKPRAAQVIIDTHNENVEEFPPVFDSLSREDKAQLRELGYETPEEVNALSKIELNRILANKESKPEGEISFNNKSKNIDKIIEDVKIITEDEITAEDEGPIEDTIEKEVETEVERTQGDVQDEIDTLTERIKTLNEFAANTDSNASKVATGKQVDNLIKEKKVLQEELTAFKAQPTQTSEVEVNPIIEDEVRAVALPRTFFEDRINRIKEVISGERKASITGREGSYIAAPLNDAFNEKDSKGRYISDGGSEVYLSKEENSEIARINAKRKQGMITSAEKTVAIQEVAQGAFKKALGTYKVIEDAPILEIQERVDAFKAQPTQQTSEVDASLLKASEVETLRQEEQAELLEAIPNAENYLTDGKVDKSKIKNKKHIAKFEKIYDKYDKLISPLLESQSIEEVLPEGPITLSENATEEEIDAAADAIIEKNSEQLSLDFESNVEEVVMTNEELFYETLDKNKRDQSLNYKEAVATQLLDYIESNSVDNVGSTDFFNLVASVEDILGNNLGRKVDNITITEDVLRDVFELLSSYPNANENILRTAADKLDRKIDQFKNPEVYNAVEQSVEARMNTLRVKLKYTKKDIASFSEETINEIINRNITKRQYMASLKKGKNTENQNKKVSEKSEVIKEIDKLFLEADTNVRTKQELNDIVTNITLGRQNLADEYMAEILARADAIALNQASLKGFSNLKEGDIVEMSDGSLKKVVKLNKGNVDLINYNDIVQNKTRMSKSQFDKGTRRIINDFNKDSENISSLLEDGNVDNLSELLRNFTTGDLTSTNEQVPTEEKLGEHFKVCK